MRRSNHASSGDSIRARAGFARGGGLNSRGRGLAAKFRNLSGFCDCSTDGHTIEQSERLTGVSRQSVDRLATYGDAGGKPTAPARASYDCELDKLFDPDFYGDGSGI